ncbi:MAG: hypothetical protein R2853_10800 [Thermomicrobiales bacterium]
MRTSFGKLTQWGTRGAVMGLLILGLAACGDMPDEGTVVEPTTEAAPGSGETTDTTHEISVKIVDGKLDPADLGDKIGTAVVLNVTGDGKEHTLAISELVDGETIAAEGETEVDFTVEGEPGKLEISLDGQPAGTFERLAP